MTLKFKKLFLLALILPNFVLWLLQYLGDWALPLAELARFTPYFLLYVLPLVALCGALWFFRAWYIFVLIGLNVLVVTFALTQFRISFAHEAERRDATIRVMTFNTKSYKLRSNPEELGDIKIEIRDFHPDILALQDAEFVPDATDNNLYAPLRNIGSFLDFNYAYSMGQYVIASKFPMSDCRKEKLGKTERSNNFFQCSLQVGAKKVDVIAVHLVSPRWTVLSSHHDPRQLWGQWRYNFWQRMSESNVLATAVSNRDNPTLILGDFNARNDSPVLASVEDMGFADAFDAAGSGWGFTYGHALKGRTDFLRIDHILASGEFSVLEAGVVHSAESDHHAVGAVLLLN